jgi:xanthine dehydrogenase large subunit
MSQFDSADHTRGTSEYVDDMIRPSSMLFAAVFPSPAAHARITRLDTEDARSLPGIRAVLQAHDIPGENQIGPIIQDEPLLAEGEVHYVGQPVAVVVAESADAARAGVRRIRMEYEELPIITDPREAFDRGEVIGATRTFESGEVDGAWATCEYVVEGRCEVGGQDHVYLETQRSRAVPLEGGRMRVFASTQSPYAGQKSIARILDIPNNHVEVEVSRVGGGFGGKEDQATPWACIAALGAAHTGKPVELVLRRSEDMAMTGKRHPYSSDFKIGADADGKIMAYSVRHFQNAGAAADLSPAVLERTLFHSTNSYFIPNVRAFGASCRTNLPPNTAFRGFGGPQGMFVIECAIARLAEAMGRPREHIQRINLLQDGHTFPYGQVVKDGRATRTWAQAESKYDLKAIEDHMATFNESHFSVKKGFAVMPICFGISFTTTSMNQAGALVHVYTDGSVSVSTGGVEMGQGLVANINRIAATALGIGRGRVRIENTNTTRVANMSPSAASSTTMLNGNATLVAIGQIMDRLAKVARNVLGVSDAADITIEDERVLCDGEVSTPGIHFDKSEERGHPFAYHTYGTAIVEVTVDCLRGTYDVDSVKIVHDMGRPLNRLVDLGQIEGGLAQGLGWMTMEELQYDDRGRLLTGALATYKVPDAYFMPDDIQVEFLEDADEVLGPYGSKAVGEPPLMYGIGVYFALRRAMQAFRPDVDFEFRAPITPERLLLSTHPERAAEYSTGPVPAAETASS